MKKKIQNVFFKHTGINRKPTEIPKSYLSEIVNSIE